VQNRSILIPLVAILLVGCAKSRPKIEELPTQETEWIRAKEKYEKGSMLRAAELLSAYVQAHPGSNRLDEALLFLGLSRQRIGDNQIAAEDFSRLIRDFPQSPYREQAEFERGQCSLNEALGPARDPGATETALTLLRAYLLRYPDGAYAETAREGVSECLERLAAKAFLNAETYLRLRRYQAAEIYLEKALEIRSDFSRAGQAMVELARVRERLLDPSGAREAWERLLEYATPARVEDNRRLEGWRLEAQTALSRLSSAGNTEPEP
jgi:outer membrane assembly lipoprotein YfiO